MKKKVLEKDPDKEYPDPKPVHVPGKSDRPDPLSLRDEMRRYIREQISRATEDSDEFESFEESDDFELDDEVPDLTSEYTVHELTMPDSPVIDDLEGEPTAEDIKSAEKPPEVEAGSEDPAHNTAPSPENSNLD